MIRRAKKGDKKAKGKGDGNGSQQTLPMESGYVASRAQSSEWGLMTGVSGQADSKVVQREQAQSFSLDRGHREQFQSFSPNSGQELYIGCVSSCAWISFLVPV